MEGKGREAKKTEKALAVVQVGDNSGFARVNGMRNRDFESMLYTQLTRLAERLDMDK